MEKAKILTKELDILSFQDGIFAYKADFLCPIVISPENHFQTLNDFLKLQNTLLSQWGSYAGPAGIAQYSLQEKIPAGVLARFDINFRRPSESEIRADVEYWGEQVMGPAVDEVSENDKERWKNNSTFKFFGKNHYFTAPDRIHKMIFSSRVFKGNFPNDLTGLIKEVDDISKTNISPLGEIIHQGYHFMHSVDGKIKYAAFKELKKYNDSQLIDYGFVEKDNGRFIFYPNGDKTHPIDFTSALIKR
jgi:hypothetical protein